MHALLFGAAPAVHDYHQGAGSFAATLEELRAGTERWVTTPVTRSNFRNLGDLPPLLASLGVAAWRLAVVAPTRTPDPVAPRLAMVAPHVVRALARAEAAGLRAGITGLPLCLLGPYADRALDDPGAAGEPCSACPAREGCGGVSDGYRALFGHGELRPRPALARRPAPAPFPPLTWRPPDLG